MNYKYLFIDMDGVLCDFELVDEIMSGYFSNKKPIKSIIEGIKSKFPESEYVYIILSYSPSEETDKEKDIWLNNNFNVKQRLYLRYNIIDKVSAMYQVAKNNNISKENIFIIDDDVKVLKNAHKAGYHVIHPTDVLI